MIGNNEMNDVLALQLFESDGNTIGPCPFYCLSMASSSETSSGV
jgi:hypothetical protein